ncbi:gamma-glutamyl-gamma-aminobutyrate hydrolase family protein [Rhizomonospora bruguierae]|uniref:gamma-glutamyl-gamma-aminobutyrate hydrolase family protein n=1 Tax=Rhizomonospora bruguierae TaxID=1581705 RepID=UPI001BD0392D|nr:gamma-glutamyl-gamma-aminobutyrate hydrolase family protein [Micromonospora sp. NBRC 107566]
MSGMVVVGVTQRALPPTLEQGERRDALDIRWHQFLDRIGAICLPLPNEPALALRHVAYFGVTALVFSGGEAIGRCAGQSPARDATEATLLRWALAGAVPVLGVCRGMQFLVDHYGGDLVRVDGHLGVDHEFAVAGVVREVRCHHRWGARAVPAEFEALAEVDGVVEHVAHRSHALTGIMWHPERRSAFDDRDLRLVARALGLAGR